MGSAPVPSPRASGALLARASLQAMTAPRCVAVVSHHQEQRGRPAMENKAFGIELEPQFGVDAGMFGVVDGHGGADVAHFVRDHLPAAFMAAAAQGRAMPFCSQAADAGLPVGNRMALFSAVLQLEHKLQAAATDELRAKAWAQGAVAAVVLVTGAAHTATRCLYVANVGDVEVVLATRTAAGGFAARVLSVKHTAADPGEASAIRGRGGFVVSDARGTPRAQGCLMPSRALGDLCVKPYVSAVPHVAAVDLTPADAFVIVASDGVWDHLTHEGAVRAVAAACERGPAGARRDAARHLLAAARASGGGQRAPEDNATAVVLFF